MPQRKKTTRTGKVVKGSKRTRELIFLKGTKSQTLKWKENLTTHFPEYGIMELYDIALNQGVSFIYDVSSFYLIQSLSIIATDMTEIG